jgi:hypothetical protein
MPFIPVANTVMSEIRMRLDGQQIENTLYWQKGGSWSSGDILTLGNALLTWWPVNYAPFVSSAVTLSEIYLTDLTSDTSGVLSVPAPTPHPAGDRSAASLPNMSRYSGVDEDGRPIPRVAGETADILSVLVVDATVDSQRRRLPGRGN